jgi:hypothetical protein
MKQTETEDTITIEGDLILTEDYKINKNLVVRGDIKGYYNINALNIDTRNIDARNINAWDINAGNIDALNIDALNIDARNIIFCDKIKVKKGCKVICKVLITDRFNIERKEQKLGEQK